MAEAPVNQNSSGEFDGSSFSNNLFSDLAPLLTLFGEQVTKQFLSQSIGYADDILLAMVPLGIITCIVSAIRVGGRKWLKAIVGRARESRAVAEMEIMSSTSDAVCELWSGTEIVRERGQPIMKEFIYRDLTDETDLTRWLGNNTVYDLSTACGNKILTIKESSQTWFPWLWRGPRRLIIDYPPVVPIATRLMQQAPNLTLNIGNATASPRATGALAFLGVVVQLVVFVVASLVTYHWKLGSRGSSSTVVGYGFPMFITGSVILCAGIFLCSYIIDSNTVETDFVPCRRVKNIRIVRIQCACTVGDQYFDSYAIRNEDGNTTLRTSRIHGDPDSSILSLFATSLALSGYVIQFVGLRAMHWSVAVTVLGSTLIMACVRAYVRRGLAASPQVVQLPKGQELAWLAMDSIGISSFKLRIPTVSDPTPEDEGNESTAELKSPKDSVRGANSSKTGPESTTMVGSVLARKAVEVRKELGQLVSWHDESKTPANQLADAITKTLEFVLSSGQFEIDFSQISTNCFGFDTTKWARREEDNEFRAEPFEAPLSAMIRHTMIDLDRIVEEEIPGEAISRLREEDHLEGSIVDAARRILNVSHRNHLASRDQLSVGERLTRKPNPSITELTIRPGLTVNLHQTDEVDITFKWDCDVEFFDSRLEKTRATKHTFSAWCLPRTGSDLQEPDGTQTAGGGDYKAPSWAMDAASLTAFLSFWARAEPDMVRFPSRPVRLIGCGWEVPIPVRLLGSSISRSHGRVQRWRSVVGNQASISDNSNLGDGIDHPSASPERITAEFQDQVSSETFTTVDFYNVWIDRGTSPDIEKAIRVGVGQSHPTVLTRFGAPVMLTSRYLRLEALQARASREGNPDSMQTATSSRLQSRLNRQSRLLSYMLPPNVIISDDAAQREALNRSKTVATETLDPRFRAQEVFTIFLLQLVSLITKVKGGAVRRKPLRGDDEDMLRWSHPALSQLAKIVQDSKLATYEEEAYVLIIPAFHAYGLLPTRPEGDMELSDSADNPSDHSSDNDRAYARRSELNHTAQSDISSAHTDMGSSRDGSSPDFQSSFIIEFEDIQATAEERSLSAR